MTQQRRDSHSTEFGLWLREQKDIDSGFGYVTTNIDFVWANYKTDDYMLLEEKRFMQPIKFYQERIFKRIHQNQSIDEKYHGFYLIQFEKTSPLDGKIFLNNNEISTSELIDFLKFQYSTDSFYPIEEVCF